LLKRKGPARNARAQHARARIRLLRVTIAAFVRDNDAVFGAAETEQRSKGKPASELRIAVQSDRADPDARTRS